MFIARLALSCIDYAVVLWSVVVLWCGLSGNLKNWHAGCKLAHCGIKAPCEANNELFDAIFQILL